MSFKDIFKNSFLDGYTNISITPYTVTFALLLTFLFAMYIFFVYRVMTRKTFYSRNFNISLVGTAMITTAIIMTMQASIVISLGMVGALSIVRFRTAVKDPIDLMFLFWSISIGIICGAGLSLIAVVLSLFMTLAIFALNIIPVAKAPMILIVNANRTNIEKDIMSVAKKLSSHPTIKARNISQDRSDLTIELRTSKGNELVNVINEIDGVTYVSLLSHNGETTF